MRGLFRTLFIFFALATARAEDSAAQGRRLPAEVEALLPAASRHVFTAVEPAWQTRVSFLRLRPDAFVGVENPSREEKKSLYREVRYFAAPTDDPNSAVKILTYYPGGKLYFEADKSPDEQFTRRNFPDGRFAEFTHWRNWKWIAGIGIDPVTGKANHFADGVGSLKVWRNGTEEARTSWYFDGRTYLEMSHRGTRLAEVRLFVGDDRLSVSSEGERLSLPSKQEYWGRKTGDDPVVSFTNSNHDLPRMPTMWSGSRKQFGIERRRVIEVWKAAYEPRRAEFVQSYTEVLTGAGQSWQSLGIEFIRDDALWPKD